MTRVVGKFFIMLLCTFCLLGVNTSFAQLYDGPVGNNTIPSTYEGFDPSPDVNSAELKGPKPPNPCGGQDPQNPICPIDDYVYVLIAIGLGYGFFKFRKMKATGV